MPRKQAARPPAAAVPDEISQPAQQQHSDDADDSHAQEAHTTPAGGNIGRILGDDPEFADTFFGAPTNIPRRLAPTGRTRDVDEDDHVEIGNNNDNNNNGHPPLIKASAKAKRAVSAAKEQASIPKDGLPENLDQLLLLQLQEDLDAWQYDLEFCRAQLDANMVVNITPAEARTFQIRVLDIGHQMRTIRHRIQYMHMTSKNALDAQAAGVGTLVERNGTIGAANNLYGNYPPGAHYHPQTDAAILPGPQGYNTAAAASGQYGGVAIRPNGARASSAFAGAYAGHSEAPQERRGPGRPPGSKNKPRGWNDTTPGSLDAGPEQAAALASAGAKRPLPGEIHVASPTPDGNDRAISVATDMSDGAKVAKRARTSLQVVSPARATPDNETGSPKSANKEDTGKNDFLHAYFSNAATFPFPSSKSNEKPAAAVGARTGTGSLTPKNGTPAPVPAADRGHGSSHESLAVRKDKIRGHGDGVSAALSSSANPVGDINNISGARISPYQRLGHWNCRLCTSHKYMSHPGPKQPSEPSMWPLRDISKIVTHLTRMHGEHSNPERCMELGAALDSNRGPFRYWVQITKRERGTSDAECDACISELKNGSLPSLLRRLSTAAKAFPKTG